MNDSSLMKVCDAFDLRYSGVYGQYSERGLHVSISCPLAPANHSDPVDHNLSCSVKLVEDGPSLAQCHSLSCGFRGTFLKLVQLAVAIRPASSDLIKLLTWVSAQEEERVQGVLDRAVETFSTKRSKTRKVLSGVVKKDRNCLPESSLQAFISDAEGYLESRGVNRETCRLYGVVFDPRLKRVVFPVRDSTSNIVGFTGRAVSKEQQPKYHNYSGLNKAKYLYGEHLIEKESPIVIVEGPIDCLSVNQALSSRGVGVVACLGGGLTFEHASTLKSFRPKKIVVFPDGDAAGSSFLSKSVAVLKPLLCYEITTPKGEDPGSLTPSVIDRLYEDSEIVF